MLAVSKASGIFSLRKLKSRGFGMGAILLSVPEVVCEKVDPLERRGSFQMYLRRM